MDIFYLYRLLLFARGASIAKSIAIDNAVIGAPTIDCGTDSVSVWVNTKKPFGGKIFVKGESDTPGCFNTISPNVDPTPRTSPRPSPTPTLSQFGTCPPCPPCDRQSSPVGMMVRFTLVISFHEHFITKVDKAYRIQCFYMEAEKTVNTEIDVSMPPTTELRASSAMPDCTYSIHRNSPDGPIVRYAMVGDKIYHNWRCTGQQDMGMFGFLINSCHVADGRGQQYEIIDQKGCSVDRVLVGELAYENDGMSASVESHVFKFADRAALDFRCAIGICVRIDGGCEGITPPKCQQQSKRLARATLANVELTQDVIADRVTVLDVDTDLPSNALTSLEANLTAHHSTHARPRRSEYCVSVVGFGVFIALVTFILTIAVVILSTLFFIKKSHPF